MVGALSMHVGVVGGCVAGMLSAQPMPADGEGKLDACVLAIRLAHFGSWLGLVRP